MTAGVVLAAGASERMGRPKALLPVGGAPAVDVIARRLSLAGCDPVVVVLGRHAGEIRAGARLEGVIAVDHGGWAAGRTSSLQAGIAALPPDAEAVVLALVDMPLVAAATIRELVRAWESAAPQPDVLAPRYAGRHGHPVVLAATLFPAIAALPPDASLRDLLRTRRRAAIDVADPGVLVDLDTPADLEHLPDAPPPPA